MIDKPLISVIMPAYNAERYIEQAINSVVDQIYPNWELIVIDDGSTDSTALIVKKIATAETRIQYFYQQNGKQGKARNKGIKESKGELLAFLDADDWWEKDRLEIEVPLLIENNELSLVFSQGYKFAENKISDFDIIVKPLWDKDDLPLFIEKNRIPIQSVLVKKAVLDKLGNFDEEQALQNAEDYELWLRMLFEGFRFMSIENRLFYYRAHEMQSTHSHSSLNMPLFTLYSSLLRKYPDDKYSRDLVKRITYFLPFATFRKMATAIIMDRVKRTSTFRALLLNIARPLPTRFYNKILARLANDAK